MGTDPILLNKKGANRPLFCFRFHFFVSGVCPHFYHCYLGADINVDCRNGFGFICRLLK